MLIALPAVSLPSMAMVAGALGRNATIAMAGAVAVSAVGAGGVLNALL